MRVLISGQLGAAFGIYWEEMERCRKGKAYWALLHVTVCLPDICAALQSSNGGTNGHLYATWADLYLPDPWLTGAERWSMRCKVLHEGRARLGPHGRYSGFSFAQPAITGQVDHKRLAGKTLVLDVGMLAQEVKAGVERWITHLETNPASIQARNAERHLESLVRVRQFPLPPAHGAPPTLPLITINRTS